MQKNISTAAKRFTGAILVLSITSFVLMAFKAKQMYSDIFQQLGISKTKADENIRSSFLNGYFHYYGAEKAKNILTGNRAEIAKDLLNYTKQQVNSEAFRKQYEQMRKDAMPEEPTEKLLTKEEVRKREIAGVEKSLAESAKTIKELPDMAKILQPTIDMLKKNLADYKDPKSAAIEMYYQGEVYEHEHRIKRYKERLAQWEKDYPANYKLVIKERLQKFISLAKTVDFTAELKTVGNKKKFVNPAYEGKSYEWKQVFRAGKEVIIPAIAFAENWIREME